MDEIVNKHLKNENSIIVSPDTCVLLHMVRAGQENEKVSTLRQLHLWEKEARNLKKRIEYEEIIWVIPRQILREFEENSDKRPTFCEFKKSLVGENAHPDETSSDEIYSRFCQKINEVGTLIKENRRAIIGAAAILEYDDKEPIYDAWEDVREYKFPNKNDQQMRDSVILQHLLKLQGKLHKQYSQTRVRFWTFDSFGNKEYTVGSHRLDFPKKESEYYMDIIIGSIDEILSSEGIIS